MRFLIAIFFILNCVFPIMGNEVQAATAQWDANSATDLNGYNLYRAVGSCTNPGAFSKISTYPKTATSGAVPNPTNDGTFCHQLTAFDTANNESLPSNRVEFLYNVNPPSAPTNFSVIP